MTYWGELSKFYLSEVFIKLVALRIDQYTKSSSFSKRLVPPGLEKLIIFFIIALVKLYNGVDFVELNSR